MSLKKKKLLAVIGDPVAHSLSPVMQNAALKKLKLPYEYIPLRIKPEQLKEFAQTKAKRLLGFNITIPHKETILPFLDRLTFEAKLIGAVNTVLQENGKLVGFNTDGSGYLMSLEREKKFNPRNRDIVMLGAGGAARAIATILLLNQARSLVIANRSIQRAQALAQELSSHFKKQKIFWCGLEGNELKKYLKRTHLLINATSVGLKGTHFIDFPWKDLYRQALVSDIVYAPQPMTSFLKEAKKAGHKIHTGEGMLVYQGALALEIWTGKKPDAYLMRRVLLKELKKNHKL